MVTAVFESLLYSILPIRSRVNRIENEEIEDEQENCNTGKNCETKKDRAHHTVDMRNHKTIGLVEALKPFKNGMNAHGCD